jgi:pimeloyl-ACP methyl ester carboxylesterase
MQLDMEIHQGDNRYPAVIFVHGLGMDKNIWVNPLHSRILGGMFPLTVLLKDRLSPGNASDGMKTLYDDLMEKGYPVLTWSQQRPAGPIDSAVIELDEIVRIAVNLTKSGIMLVGHSRGGLIARKYLMINSRDMRGLITISTPHRGSSVAGFSKYVAPLVSMINPVIPAGEKGTLAFAVKRILEFLRSKALKELLPESDFFKSLNDCPLDHISYASVGGTDPTLFTVFNLSFPDAFEKVIPQSFYPEEMRAGKGDGLVTAESSRMPWASEHENYACNHAGILFDEEVKNKLISKIGEIA